MSKYELDDELVQEFLGTLHESEDETPSGKLGNDLRRQIPIPVPTLVGAVVRTDQGVFVRVRRDNEHLKEWFHDHPDTITFTTTGEIGRIAEVLSEGVDL